MAHSDLSAYLIDEVETPLVPVLAAMEATGYALDINRFEALRIEIDQESRELHNATGIGDINSAKDVRDFLRGADVVDNGLRGDDLRTQLKTYRPDSQQYHALSEVLELRGLRGARTTCKALIPDIGSDNRVHIASNQFGSATGRITTGVLQTIPRTAGDPHRIRGVFTVAPGNVLVAADYVNFEPVVLANVSGDTALLEILRRRGDIYAHTATQLYGLNCAPETVPSHYRAAAKKLTLGIINGQTAYGIAADLGIPATTAEHLVHKFFTLHPGADALIRRVHDAASTAGYVVDCFGRRRQLRDALGACRGDPRVSKALRSAQNHVVQAPAATLLKIAMLRCYAHITEHYPATRMLLCIHDEIHFEVPASNVDRFCCDLRDLMSGMDLTAFGFSELPDIEISTGMTWADLRPRPPAPPATTGPIESAYVEQIREILEANRQTTTTDVWHVGRIVTAADNAGCGIDTLVRAGHLDVDLLAQALGLFNRHQTPAPIRRP